MKASRYDVRRVATTQGMQEKVLYNTRCITYGSVCLLLPNMYASFCNVNASYYAVKIVHNCDLTVFGETKCLVVPVGVKSA